MTMMIQKPDQPQGKSNDFFFVFPFPKFNDDDKARKEGKVK